VTSTWDHVPLEEEEREETNDNFGDLKHRDAQAFEKHMVGG